MEKLTKKELIEQADKVLTELRPHLWADEGDVKIVDINESNQLLIQWMGACTQCKLSDITLKYGIKSAVMEQLEEITDVVVVN